jgi:putative phosphoribosyl transferase
MLIETVTLQVGAADALDSVEKIGVEKNGAEEIQGDLRVPAQALGLVVFAHGSGSSRFSARNRSVAAALEERSLGTLLLDLLTPKEADVDARTTEFRFDIPRLARRVVQACDWLAARADLAALPLGCFGASTGAAAALIAAAERPDRVQAVVSRGGRPDLARSALPAVRAPTLLIVGGADPEVLELNRQAMARMTQARVELAIVPHATHLFEEPGALTQVFTLAGEWFTTHLHRSDGTTV